MFAAQLTVRAAEPDALALKLTNPAIEALRVAVIETREVMGMREASTYLGVSRETLYKYLSDGRIPGFKLGNRWKFKKTVLDRWMEAQSQARQSTAPADGRP